MKRCHIPLKTKLAAALACILKIPHSHAVMMSEEHILSLVQWDHYPRRKSEGGTDDFFNLVPRAILEHREKTAKVDLPEIAKNKRLDKEHREFQERILRKEPGKSARPPSRWPKRPFQKKKAAETKK